MKLFKYWLNKDKITPDTRGRKMESNTISVQISGGQARISGHLCP